MPKLFIGNIPHASSDAELQEWVESQGFQVESAQIIRDRSTGPGRCTPLSRMNFTLSACCWNGFISTWFTAGATSLNTLMSINRSGWKLLRPIARSLPAL